MQEDLEQNFEFQRVKSVLVSARQVHTGRRSDHILIARADD